MLRLGIDIGSVTAKIAALEGDAIRHVAATRTHGRPARALRKLLRRAVRRLGNAPARVAATGSGKPLVPDPCGRISEIVAHARAAAALHPEARTLLEIGGQDAKLIWLPGTGEPRVLDHALNDLCAAGTGAFLDQQAARLGIDAARLGRLAASSRSPATVAGRCAVFAKTDMIHLQQRGVPLADICAGVCHALVRNVVATLARGRPLPAPLLLQGGVSLSAGVRAAVPAVTGIPADRILVPDRPVAMGAIGAALLADRLGGATTLGALVDALRDDPLLDEAPAPVLRRPGPPAGPAERPRADLSEPLRLGIDVGSASTKAVLVDRDGRIAASSCLPTAGRPLRAVREVLAALAAQAPRAVVGGASVTGSGRHLTALWLHADATLDEITAQARGALAGAGPGVTGIIEIGGQDAKAIAVREGRVAGFAMNRLCAAGTGSFLEEQAARVGVGTAEFADEAFASTSPSRLAGKCAVFMDADLVHHQQRGAGRRDLLAGLAHAVVENYLRRVAGPVDLGDRPVFQGGVAANAAVVAALEHALGRPMAVHPEATVSGALGAALSLAPGESTPGPSRTIDDLARTPEPATEAKACRSCENRCEITVARVDGGATVTLGGACGRYDRGRLAPDARRREEAIAALLAEREKLWAGPERARTAAPPRGRVGVPRAILAHDLYPFHRAFLERLGYEAVASPPSRRETLLRAANALTAEPCLPAKLMLGHVAALGDQGVDAVFLPAILSAREAAGEAALSEPSRITRRYPCMYGLASADLACAASLADEPLEARGRPDAGPSAIERALRRMLGARDVPAPRPKPRLVSARPRLLAPELMLVPESFRFRALCRAFARREGLDTDDVCRAVLAGLDEYAAFRRRLAEMGRRYLEENRGVPVALVLGHPYVVHDAFLNLQVMRRLARAGFAPLPCDMAPEPQPLGESWTQVGWRSNRDLLRAAAWAADRDDVHPVIVTCFGCGPDAFVVRYLEEELGDRPRLTLEFDEHQAEAGLETRLEAFRHAVGGAARAGGAGPVVPQRRVARPLAPRVSGRLEDLRGRTVIVPYFADVAAAFRGFFEARGIDARLGPEIDESSLATGRRFAGGQECNPFAYFAGDMARALAEPGADPSRLAFFLPSSEGACLLSQYGRGFASAARRIGADALLVHNPNFSELTGDAPLGALVRFWESLSAIEALAQLAADLRPFERQRGAIDRVRREAAARVGDAVARGGVRRALEDAVARLAAVPRRPWRPRPAIGIVGDLFTRANDAANRGLVRTLEDAGCRVLVPPTITDVAAYSPGEWTHLGREAGLFAYTLRSVLLETWQRLAGAWVTMPIGRLSPPAPVERPYRDAVELARPYLGRPVEAILTLSISKAVEQLEAGARGVLSVICHGCMVGILSESAFRPLREAYPGRPILTLTYDGLGDTHAATRIEAFVQRILEAE